MTAIPARVLAVDKEGDQYRIMVRIGLARYRGSFHTLTFGEKKPRIGFCHEGQLELVYHKDPYLKTGQPFPLWTLECVRSTNTRLAPAGVSVNFGG